MSKPSMFISRVRRTISMTPARAVALAGIALLAPVPLTPAAQGASPPAAAGLLVLRLQVSGSYQFTGTLSRRVSKQDTACIAGKSGNKPTYAVGFNASNLSPSAHSGSALGFAAGVQPYRPAVARYRGNKNVAVILVAGGSAYAAGLGEAPAGSLQLQLSQGGRSGTLTALRVPSSNHKKYVDITAQWTCPGVLAP